MKLYHVQEQGESQYVEAENFGEALALWRKYMTAQFQTDADEEPDTIALVHDEPVIRAADFADEEEPADEPAPDQKPRR